ncbi:MAG: hypothetical protein GY827_05890 [Cytophagales bacterium]|nr:hypothetical protein [Cytophagales bacterium]
MNFKRTNQRTRKSYYQIFILIELLILISLYYFNLHWAILLFVTPIILVDTWSNARCVKRQKRHVIEINISDKEIKCVFSTKEISIIPIEKSLFSIREEKFDRDKTEIEIRQKTMWKSKLIGRLHIDNWNQVFDIKKALLTYSVSQIKYRPEGYWSKYGVFTADVVITTAALTLAEVADGEQEIQTEHLTLEIL